MSGEYTPDTEHVREIYAQDSMHFDVAEAMFDRWLAAHDAKVKAEAWDEGFRDGLRQESEGDDGPRYANPYRD